MVNGNVSAQIGTTDVGPGLAPYLASVQHGQDEDFRTPLWEKRPRAEIIAMWDKVFEQSLNVLPGRLGMIEEQQKLKIGPLSVRLPLSERLPQIEAYYTQFRRGVPKTTEYYTWHGDGRLRPLSLERAADTLAGNTNSGFPDFTRRNRVREAAIAQAAGGKWREYPAILGWRGQSAGLEEDPKQRTVWMYPYSTNIREATVFRPVHDALVAEKPFAAWRTPDDVATAVSELFKEAKEYGTPVYSIDFTSFDQSVGPFLSAHAWDAIRSYFQRGYQNEIGDIQEVFYKINLIISPTRKLSGIHGVPSGSVFTNMVDTLVQLYAHKEVSDRLNVQCAEYCQAQGDDGLLVFDRPIEIDAMADAFSELGLDANAEKQFVGDDDCVYLQRYYTSDRLGGMYPTYRALNSLMGQERFYDEKEWGPELVILRSIMILENVKHHPLFEALVRFTMDGDKYRLGASWPGGIDSLLFGSDVIQRATSLPGFIPSYNQEDRIRGVRGFRTYAIIKENGV